MIKRTSRKIAAHIYWIAATFIFLALIAIPLLPRALGASRQQNRPQSSCAPCVQSSNHQPDGNCPWCAIDSDPHAAEFSAGQSCTDQGPTT